MRPYISAGCICVADDLTAACDEVHCITYTKDEGEAQCPYAGQTMISCECDEDCMDCRYDTGECLEYYWY